MNLAIKIHVFLKIHFARYARITNPYYGLDRLDEVISKYIGTEKSLYIEIGGNDGYSQSNTKFFEQQFGWSGILIEPDPELFKKMRRNRSSQNYFANFACVSDDFMKESTTLIKGNLLSSVLDSKNHIADPIKHATQKNLSQFENADKIEVPVSTLTNILVKSKISRSIKFLSLDVEGYELEVLKGLDLNKFRVEWICVEVRKFEEIDNYLTKKGYHLITRLSLHDFLYRLGR